MTAATDIRAMRALALSLWQSLTTAQRSALRRARATEGSEAPRLEWNTHAKVISSLVARGLVTVEPIVFTTRARYPLTLEARLALECGREAEAAAAKARHRRRKRGQS